ncbi:hypothetical protein [Streptomyces sp. SID14515]|uniref:hypothetical protein n=1 Tax=Streptomyces sp. SID14515 TaxID=2706074 RepID=UPI0013C68D46|nr:hypothetical protein [Streptomyces sp. SID14515]NEB35907.1 hypothetical protein [Streptomyces sp. SID14515]
MTDGNDKIAFELELKVGAVDGDHEVTSSGRCGRFRLDDPMDTLDMLIVHALEEAEGNLLGSFVSVTRFVLDGEDRTATVRGQDMSPLHRAKIKRHRR